jgi:hypothetical protein
VHHRDADRVQRHGLLPQRLLQAREHAADRRVVTDPGRSQPGVRVIRQIDSR